jgi:hypothetical protein
MGLIWQRSSSGLERLTATNTELLMMLTDNVSTMDQALAPIMVRFSQYFSGLRAEFSAISNKISIFERATTDTATVAATEGLLNALQEVQTRAEAIKTELGDWIAMLNGGLALNV